MYDNPKIAIHCEFQKVLEGYAVGTILKTEYYFDPLTERVRFDSSGMNHRDNYSEDWQNKVQKKMNEEVAFQDFFCSLKPDQQGLFFKYFDPNNRKSIRRYSKGFLFALPCYMLVTESKVIDRETQKRLEKNIAVEKTCGRYRNNFFQNIKYTKEYELLADVSHITINEVIFLNALDIILNHSTPQPKEGAPHELDIYPLDITDKHFFFERYFDPIFEINRHQGHTIISVPKTNKFLYFPDNNLEECEEGYLKTISKEDIGAVIKKLSIAFSQNSTDTADLLATQGDIFSLLHTLSSSHDFSSKSVKKVINSLYKTNHIGRLNRLVM